MKEMQRGDRLTSREEAWEILRQSPYGVLCTTNDEGWPYGVQVFYVCVGEKIYFHCGAQGQKMRSMAKDSRVCLTATRRWNLVPQRLTAGFESAMVLGHCSRVEDPKEWEEALAALCRKFCPHHMEEFPGEIQRNPMEKTGVYCIVPVEVTGKRKIEK